MEILKLRQQHYFGSRCNLPETTQAPFQRNHNRDAIDSPLRGTNIAGQSFSQPSSEIFPENRSGSSDCIAGWSDSLTSIDATSTTMASFSSSSQRSIVADEAISNRLLDYGIVQLEQRGRVQIDEVPLSIKNAVDEIHQRLFSTAGQFDSVQSLMKNYCECVIALGIPIDRLYYGGIGLHPKLTAYMWKWEPEDFIFREMPEGIFERRNELFSRDEPFCVLEQGRADFVRIKDSDDYIPPDTKLWFRGGGYRDYYALPDIHGNESKGGLAWATKAESGFSQDHISFFNLTLPALTTVLRLHTNDLVLRTLRERMELEIGERMRQLEEANLRLENANERLAVQANKQLEYFACMSHEIRTPLNCIVGLSSVLLESPEDLTPSVADSVQMMYSSADLLLAVVDDVLDYSKLESGIFEVDIRLTNLQVALNGVVHAMQEKATQNQVQIKCQYGATLPETVRTDPRRLQQVLYNLLGNACKFSKTGGQVELRVSIEQVGESKVLRFAIKDYGKGIDKKHFQAIFQPFNQASKETQTIYGGTGLGLSITSTLVKRLGGKISVKSELGVFAEFVVDLPFASTPMDVATLTRLFENTTIVTLEEQNESGVSCGPFRPDVSKTYNLDVVRASCWSEVNKIVVEVPGRDWSDQHYLLVVPSAPFDLAAFTKFCNWAGNCTLITYGRQEPPPQSSLHWTACLHGIFPTIALKSIVDLRDHVPIKSEIRRELICAVSPKGFRMVSSPVPSAAPTISIGSSSAALSPIAVPPFMRKSSSFPLDNIHCLIQTPSELIDAASISSTLAREEPRNANSTGRAPRILIAEDNLVNQKVLIRVLQKLGVQDDDIAVVADGQQAVEISKVNIYDMIFMDIQMPVMDGLEATELIKAREQQGGEKSKIIFCTAHAVENFRLQAEQVGADGFVSKPFNLKKIQAILKEHLPNHTTNQ